jgi:hypothetical protein
MNRLTTNITLLLAAFALVVGAYFALNQAQHAEAVGPMATVISAATTTAATSITSSARIMATTTNPLDPTNSYTRVYAVVCNPNANPVYLNLDQDKAADLTAGKVTTVIAAASGYSACYEITDRNQYSGSVTASSTNQTATTITVKQYVQ